MKTPLNGAALSRRTLLAGSAVLAGGAGLATVSPAAPLTTVPAGVVVPPAVTADEIELDTLFSPATPDPRLEGVRRLIVRSVETLEKEALPNLAVVFRALKATAASGDEAAIRFLIGLARGEFSEFTMTIDRIELELDAACCSPVAAD